MTAPFAKVEKTEDGGREVWGYATIERVDKSGEIADFNGTVKAFGVWSDEISKQTNGKSLGNVRYMHQPITAGKMIHYEPSETTIKDDKGNDQVAKAIWVGAYIPPTKADIIKDVDEGILSAFSIGGNYAKKWWDGVAKAFRFIPDLAEFSLVDNPCVEGASIVNVINKAHGPWEKESRNLEKGSGNVDIKEVEKSKVEGGEKKEELVKNKEVTKVDDKIEKACKDIGITSAQFAELLKAVVPVDDERAITAVAEISSDFSADNTGIFPSDGKDVIDIPSGVDDVVEAEKATYKAMVADLKKAIEVLEGGLEKANVAISKGRMTNLEHAKNHIQAAQDGTLYGPAEHLATEGQVADGNTGEEPQDVNADKAMYGELQKGIDRSNIKFEKALVDNLNKTENKLEALFKGVAGAESLNKATESLTKMYEELLETSKLVKEIHKTPVNDNLIMNGSNPMLKSFDNNKFNYQATEENVLESMIKGTNDVMVKDKLGQELAMRRMKQNLNGQGVK
jgi:hypothetical protein